MFCRRSGMVPPSLPGGMMSAKTVAKSQHAAGSSGTPNRPPGESGARIPPPELHEQRREGGGTWRCAYWKVRAKANGHIGLGDPQWQVRGSRASLFGGAIEVDPAEIPIPGMVDDFFPKIAQADGGERIVVRPGHEATSHGAIGQA